MYVAFILFYGQAVGKIISKEQRCISKLGANTKTDNKKYIIKYRHDYSPLSTRIMSTSEGLSYKT
jgi:hypothetical protein